MSASNLTLQRTANGKLTFAVEHPQTLNKQTENSSLEIMFDLTRARAENFRIAIMTSGFTLRNETLLYVSRSGRRKPFVTSKLETCLL